MKQIKINKNVIKRVSIVLAILLVVIVVLIMAKNFSKEKVSDTTNLIINNRNVTSGLRHDIKIEDGIIYMSMNDIKNYFDKYIYLEEETDEIVTTYNDKIASMGFESNKLTLNGSVKKTNARAISDGEIYYLPISEMLEVYNIELENIEKTNTITLDSLDRRQVKATLKSKVSVKSQGKFLSRIVEKAEKGSEVIVINNEATLEGKK